MAGVAAAIDGYHQTPPRKGEMDDRTELPEHELRTLNIGLVTKD